MATGKAPDATRRYRGTSAEQRRTQRREQLILAAITVYGERGYRNATVKAVCAQAGLTERYFYESFANSEALLVETYRAVTRALLAELEGAADGAGGSGEARVRAIIDAYLAALQRDPPSARVFLVEVAGVSAALDRVFAGSLDAFGLLLARTQGSGEGDPLLRTAVVGGVIHLASTWVASDYAAPADAVADAAMPLCLLLSR
jgi:AcrR family transcriptional regulator